MPLRGRIPFRYSSTDYDNQPLEWLIKTAKRHCDNDDLIKRLNAARKKRNFVAHNAISQYVRHLEKNPPLAQSILEGLNETETEGNALVGELWNELNKLQATSSALPPLPPEFFVHLTLEGTIPRGFYSELDQPRHIDSCTLYD